MSIDISLIIPVYNTAPYLKTCLDSVTNQTIQNTEIIIIDDASTDNSLSIIEEYAAKDSRIKVISLNKNSPGGAGIPSNIGLRKARGKYIGFVDSDDWIEPNMFEMLYENALKHNSDYTFCDFNTFDENSNKIYPSYDKHHWSSIFEENNKSSLLSISPVPWRKLLKRSFLLENNLLFPEGNYFYEDTPFHFMVTLKANKISIIDKSLYYHRVSRAEQTMNGKGRKFFAFLAHIKTIYRFMEQEHYLEDYLDSFLIFTMDNFGWVWERLNWIEREEFFYGLRDILLNIDIKNIEKFCDRTNRWNSLRINYIRQGEFKQYKRLIFKVNSKIGFILRTVDYFKENGLLKTIRRIF